MLQEYLPALPELLGDLPIPPSGSGLPGEVRERLAACGAEYLGFQWPALTAGSYLRFTRTGDRAAFEDAYFVRRRALCALVLAEWADGRGRFLDGVVDGVWALCEESGWQAPAHNGYVRDAAPLPLPDPARPVLDLFACETGALLALAVRLVGDALDKISPVICRRVRDELERRIVSPYLDGSFWWMGESRPVCNWTPWCTQNVLLAVFAMGAGQDIKRRAAVKAIRSLDRFLAETAEDGCCEEGAYYYRHSALDLWGALEVLNQVGENAFAGVFREKKLWNMADYIVRAHVAGDWYLNYADCSAKPGPCTAREYLFGRAVGDPALMALAAADCKRSERWELPHEINLWYRLLAAQNRARVVGYAADHPPLTPEGSFYPSTGLWIAREGPWCAAVRAGHNGGSHGHSDAGSLIVYRDGRPLLIDIGVERYTAKTFSKDRGGIWAMRSDWHNLPTLDGAVQQSGAAWGATGVKWSLGGRVQSISMELSTAYRTPRPCTYRRTVRLARGVLSMEDCCEGVGEAVLSLLFCERPVWDDGVLNIGQTGRIEVTGKGEPVLEVVPVHDPMLRAVWPEALYRVLLPVCGSVKLAFHAPQPSAAGDLHR